MAHNIVKKQEEWNSQKVRELLRLPENKKCFDCPTKSPFFVNVSIQTFLCSRCSGLVREVGHRVKSISASKFSGPEVVALQHGGNEVARTIWLSNYRTNTPEPETDGDVRMFMRQKYYEQKWLNREKGVEHATNVKRIIKELYSEDGTSKPTTLGRSGSINDKKKSGIDNRPKIVPTQSWVDDNVPIGLIPSVQQKHQQQQNGTSKLSMDDLLLNDDMMLSPKSPRFPTIPQPIISNNSKIAAPTSPTTPVSASLHNDIFADLAGLAPAQPVIVAQSYSGGILQPNSPISPSTSVNSVSQNFPTLPKVQQPQTQPQQKKESTSHMDPYAALRDLSIGSKPITPTSSPYISNGSNTMKIKTPTDDLSAWGDFQKSPTQSSFTINNTPKNSSTMFRDLDPLFK